MTHSIRQIQFEGPEFKLRKGLVTAEGGEGEKVLPRPGIEPGSPAWDASVVTTRL